MSVITTTAPSTAGARLLGLAPDALSRSLGLLASGLRRADAATADAAPGADALQAQCRQAEAGATEVQNGLSYAQAAAGFLSDMTALVSRMGQLADAAKTDGGAAAEFSTLQQQLRDTIGGASAEIGGSTGVDDPHGTFNGTALFGNTPGLTVAAGADQSVTLPALNLRTGAMGALIRQDASGTFAAGAGDAATPQTLAAALHQLAGQRAGLADAQVQLQAAASKLQIEASNLGAVVPPLADAGAAGVATADARATLLSDPSLALLAHAGQVPGTALKILNS